MAMVVKIGRVCGPSTDIGAKVFLENDGDLEVLMDTLAAVNAVANDKESWFVITPDGVAVIPETRKHQRLPDA